jgi:hypothetical protein
MVRTVNKIVEGKKIVESHQVLTRGYMHAWARVLALYPRKLKES